MDAEVVLSVLVGGVITLVVAFVFHRAASSSLDQKAERLERLVDILAKIVEDPERTSIRRDPQTGRMLGNVYDETGGAVVVRVTTTGTDDVVSPKEDQENG